jgi:hypothetical protein
MTGISSTYPMSVDWTFLNGVFQWGVWLICASCGLFPPEFLLKAGCRFAFFSKGE